MLIIALIGLFINIVVAWIMLRGRRRRKLKYAWSVFACNKRHAWIYRCSYSSYSHYVFGWGWADPLASVIVAILVLRSGLNVTKSGLHVLMEGAPSNINTKDIIKTIKNSKKLKIFMTFMFGQ